MAGTLNFDNPVFGQFAFYGSLVIGKTILMSPLTSLFRLKNKTFSNPEDLALGGKKLNFNDQAVERVRRCHLNDLENVVPFVLIGLLYVLSGPDPTISKRLFQAFTAVRFFHTVAYLVPLPQPSRATAFFVGCCINMTMVVNVAMHAAS